MPPKFIQFFKGKISPNLAILCLLILTVLTGSACITMKGHPSMVVLLENSKETYKTGQIIDTKKGTAITFDELIDHLSAKDIVFIGEVHNNPEHHLIQIQILQALTHKKDGYGIGLEFFSKDKQPPVDNYLNGNIAEGMFLKKSSWAKGWGFDYHLYRPVFLYSLQNRLRIVALNAKSSIIRKVARKGIKGLSREEREKLPDEIDLHNQAHKDYLLEIFQRHSHGDLTNFDFFYEAQCLWDETMADNIVSSFKEDLKKMVVLTGNGHIIFKFGIPDRVQRRADLSFATVMPLSSPGPKPLDRGMADFIWLTRARE